MLTCVAVEKHPPVDEPSVGRHHFPPIGVLTATGVGAADCHREGVSPRVAADGDIYNIRVFPWRRSWFPGIGLWGRGWREIVR